MDDQMKDTIQSFNATLQSFDGTLKQLTRALNNLGSALSREQNRKDDEKYGIRHSF